jgi:hypothetical protein
VSLTLTYRPLPPIWPSGERTPDYQRRSANFKASWTRTMNLLDREVAQLGARSIVLEAGFRESDIRNDGLPRASARPNDPAVIVDFESRYGPLRYGCDRFTTYEANLRAIALALEALRLVDRYGVTKRGEQYKGWIALEAHTVSQEEAEQFLRAYGPGDLRTQYRAAAMVLHPDKGGAPEQWAKLQNAKVVLGL